MNAIAIGAFGRVANLTDWEVGKDFMIYNGPYFSIRDIAVLKQDGYTGILFCAFPSGELLFKVKL